MCTCSACYCKLVRHGHWKSLTKTDYLPLKWSVTGGFAHPVATESQERRSEEAHWSQQKRISDHNTEKTLILWPHLPDEGRTNVKSHSVWCDGRQSTEKETMSRMDGWYHGLVQGGPAHTEMEGNRPGWVADVFRHAIDTNESPRLSSQRRR